MDQEPTQDVMPGPARFGFAQLTPTGSGALATIRIQGPGAVNVVATRIRARSGRPFDNDPADRPLLRSFGKPPGEPVVLHRRVDDSVEIHCHGGTAAVERIKHHLASAGGQANGWQEWIRDQEADPIAAEARIAMAHARTERTAAILLDQYAGAFRRAMEKIERLISAGKKPAALEQIQTLLARAEVGRHLTNPWRIVLAGHPNVGKSSLLNALLGYERAIVHATAGTTRDVLTATTAIDGWPVELVDTAGLPRMGRHPPDDAVLEQGLALTEKQIAASDLLVLVFDRSKPLSDDQQQWLRDWPRALPVDNKSDLPRAAGPRPMALETSALHGAGLAELLLAIAQCLVPEPPPPGAAVPFIESQCCQLREMAVRML